MKADGLSAMRVLNVSIADANPHACTSAAYRIHVAVRGVGVDSTLLVRDKTLHDSTVRQFDPGGGLLKKTLFRLRADQIKSAMKPYRATRPKGLEMFTDSRSAFGRAIVPALAGYDVLHLHWFREFIDWRYLAEEPLTGKPVLLTLHDTAAFTGGCHYASGCERFVERCGKCPQLGSQTDDDLSRQNWERKRRALSGRRGPTFVAGCSEWIAGEAKRSSLLGPFPVKAVHNGVDLDVFQPRNKAAARELLGIAPDAAVVMFTAAQISNPRKGLSYLMEALAALRGVKKITLLSAGQGSAVGPAEIPHVSVGAVNSERYLSLVYSAADVFVIPSLEENFALTALEAAACGLPVVGFNTGGIPELVQDGVTGFVVPLKDAATLASRLRELITDPALCAKLGAASRKRIECLFSLEAMGRKYRDLYLELTNRAAN